MQNIQARRERIEALRREIGACDARTFAAFAAFTACGVVAESGPDPQALERLFRTGFHECLGESAGDHSVALAFALACAARAREPTGRPVLYAALAGERQEAGQPYPPGLAAHGLASEDLLHVAVRTEKELYWVAEEGLGSAGLRGILLCAGSRERLYDFTISRRLKLRAERASMPLFLVRSWRGEGATAATARWRVSRMPSLAEPFAAPRHALIGPARFSLRIERGPLFRHQSWEFEYDASGGFRLAAPLADGPAGSRRRRDAARAA